MNNIIILNNIKTTGLKHYEDSIIYIESLAINANNFDILSEFRSNMKYQEGKKQQIDDKVATLNGITHEEILNSKDSKEVLKEYVMWLANVKKSNNFDGKLIFASYSDFVRNFMFTWFCSENKFLFSKIFFFIELYAMNLGIEYLIKNNKPVSNNSKKFSRDNLYNEICDTNLLVNSNYIVLKDYYILREVFGFKRKDTNQEQLTLDIVTNYAKSNNIDISTIDLNSFLTYLRKNKKENEWKDYLNKLKK